MTRPLRAAAAIREVGRGIARFAACLDTRAGDRCSERKFARFAVLPGAAGRSFLFLQGPQSPFLRRLGLALAACGVRVTKVNFCGGDIFHWPRPFALSYRGPRLDWPVFAAALMDRRQVTDLVLQGDLRPLHHDAICLAQTRGIAVHVLEEGYLRPSYITMEEGGVNANSPLPATPEAVLARAEAVPQPGPSYRIVDALPTRVYATVKHHLGNVLLWSLFPRYRTHRPYCIGRELMGWIPRYLNRTRRLRRSAASLAALLAAEVPFFLFPLQLDSDMQIRSYSHFGLLDSIMLVLASFATAAPPECRLLVKNHPLDNGLIDLRRYLDNFSRSVGVADRVVYLDGGPGRPIMAHPACRGVVLVNSTIGLEAMALGRPVYSLGRSPYAMPGLAVTPNEMSLETFWREPRPVDETLLTAFIRVLHADALLAGNFYTDVGIAAAISGILKRLGIAEPPGNLQEDAPPC